MMNDDLDDMMDAEALARFLNLRPATEELIQRRVGMGRIPAATGERDGVAVWSRSGILKWLSDGCPGSRLGR